MKKGKIIALSADEMMALNPRGREAYASKIVKDILKQNPDGLNIKQVASLTNLSYNTAVKHLEMLVALREARKEFRKEAREMGDFKVAYYFPIGDIGDEMETIHCQYTTYRFARLENETGKYVFVKEIEKDEFRGEQVKGVLMIRFEDYLRFTKALNTFANKVISDEPQI